MTEQSNRLDDLTDEMNAAVGRMGQMSIRTSETVYTRTRDEAIVAGVAEAYEILTRSGKALEASA